VKTNAFPVQFRYDDLSAAACGPTVCGSSPQLENSLTPRWDFGELTLPRRGAPPALPSSQRSKYPGSRPARENGRLEMGQSSLVVKSVDSWSYER